ncbi:MAG: alpha/beta fold hydrolase [Gammaproteobacteria bacterium]
MIVFAGEIVQSPMIPGNRSTTIAIALWACVAMQWPLIACGEDYSKGLPQIPGEFADVGTHRLHHLCTGDGTPTIVIDNGIAGSATEWYDVQEQLATRFRTCVYDRAGYAWSEPGPAPRTTAQIADELQSLLEVKGENGPFVFVGHSFGGFTAIRMASLLPAKSLGVVLVDSSSPEISFDHALPHGHIVNPIAVGAASGTDKVPSTPREMARFLNSRRKALFVQMDEIANFKVSAKQISAAGPLKNLPMLIVARDSAVEAMTDMESAHREAEWRQAQEKLSQLSANGQLTIAEGSDHFIHLRKPQWLASEIENFIDELLSAGI